MDIRLYTGSDSTAELLKAVADILWPVITMIAILVFRHELRGIFRRLKRGKLLGNEIELESDVEQLQLVTQAAQKSLEGGQDGASSQVTDSLKEDIARILAESASSPRGAIVSLSIILERTLEDLVGSSTHLGLIQLLRRAQEQEKLSPEVLEAIRQFSRVRNDVVHTDAVPGGVIRRAIAYGLDILRIIAG